MQRIELPAAAPAELWLEALPESRAGEPRRVGERLTVRRMLDALLGEGGYTLSHTPAGAPRLEAAGEAVNISISHSRTHALVALSRSGRIGVDIESPRSQLARVAPSFLSVEELGPWSATLDTLLQAWTAKEAAYKLFEPSGITLRSISIAAPASGAPLAAAYGPLRALVRHIPLPDGQLIALATPDRTDHPTAIRTLPDLNT